MTKIDFEKRLNNSSGLNAFNISGNNYAVESSKGNVFYKVVYDENMKSCTCPDFQTKSNDPEFMCKHIIAVINGQFNGKPKLDERFITNIKGKDFVLYAGLLDLAHQKGIEKIDVEVIQYPQKDNGFEAICKAIVHSKNGETYSEWGDACPSNVNPMLKTCLLRMANTRAKSRCFRDMTNVGMVCLEELGNIDDVITNGTSTPKPKTNFNKPVTKEIKPDEKPKTVQEIKKENPVKQKHQAETKKEERAKNTNNGSATKPTISSAQKRAILNLSKRRGLSTEDIEKKSQQIFNTNFEFLSSSEASSFIRELQQAA